MRSTIIFPQSDSFTYKKVKNVKYKGFNPIQKRKFINVDFPDFVSRLKVLYGEIVEQYQEPLQLAGAKIYQEVRNKFSNQKLKPGILVALFTEYFLVINTKLMQLYVQVFARFQKKLTDICDTLVTATNLTLKEKKAAMHDYLKNDCKILKKEFDEYVECQKDILAPEAEKYIEENIKQNSSKVFEKARLLLIKGCENSLKLLVNKITELSKNEPIPNKSSSQNAAKTGNFHAQDRQNLKVKTQLERLNELKESLREVQIVAETKKGYISKESIDILEKFIEHVSSRIWSSYIDYINEPITLIPLPKSNEETNYIVIHLFSLTGQECNSPKEHLSNNVLTYIRTHILG